MLLPPALGFSPHPPVSVYGTGTHYTIAAFLGTWLTRFATLFRSTSRLRIIQRICLLYTYPACTGRSSGGIRRENAGMSSERKVGILSAEYLRFPE